MLCRLPRATRCRTSLICRSIELWALLPLASRASSVAESAGPPIANLAGFVAASIRSLRSQICSARSPPPLSWGRSLPFSCSVDLRREPQFFFKIAPTARRSTLIQSRNSDILGRPAILLTLLAHSLSVSAPPSRILLSACNGLSRSHLGRRKLNSLPWPTPTSRIVLARLLDSGCHVSPQPRLLYVEFLNSFLPARKLIIVWRVVATSQLLIRPLGSLLRFCALSSGILAWALRLWSVHGSARKKKGRGSRSIGLWGI